MVKVTITECLILFLICSCNYNRNRPEKFNKTERQIEVLKVMRNEYIKHYEDSNNLTAKQRNELRKMKKDFYYELSEKNMFLNVPGPSWEIIGPLTLTQVEQRSIDEIKDSQDIPQIPFGHINDYWNRITSQYKDGDEFFYFKSNRNSWKNRRGVSGYALVRNNKVVEGLLTAIN